MEILKTLTPLIVAFVSGILSNQMKDFLFSTRIRKLKKFNGIINEEKIFEIIDNKFNQEFVNPDLKESYFYIQTGISTNEKSIESYITLKNKLKGNYDWNSIRKAMPYLKFDNNNEIYISFSKKDILFKNIELGFSFFLFILGMIGLLIFSNFIYAHTFKKLILVIIVFLIPILFGVFFLSNLSSYFIAKRMKSKMEIEEKK